MIDTLIIGGGPAGLAAAIYLARFRRSVVVADAEDSRAARIPITRNCPGFPDGIAGTELLDRLQRQAGGFGASIRYMPVRRLASESGIFTAVGNGSELQARTVLLATGVADLMPQLPGMAASLAQGRVRFCPVCDAFEAVGQKIGVIGGGDHALKEALFLRDYSDRVSLLTKSTYKTAERTREEAAKAGIEILEKLKDIEPHGGGLRLTFSERECAEFDFIYAALGCNVRSELATSVGATCDENGSIIVDDHQRTSVPGLWAAGDVVSALNQIAVAFGHAAVAATDIHNNLRDVRPNGPSAL